MDVATGVAVLGIMVVFHAVLLIVRRLCLDCCVHCITDLVCDVLHAQHATLGGYAGFIVGVLQAELEVARVDLLLKVPAVLSKEHHLALT